MPIQVTRETVLDAPIEEAFAYVANYRNVGEWLSGISSFTPLGDLDYGLNAVFDAALNLGITTLHSTVKVIDFAEGTMMELDSVKGSRTPRSGASSPSTTPTPR